jgi:hypothetical protein
MFHTLERAGQDAIRPRSNRHASQAISAPGTTAITIPPAARAAISARVQRPVHPTTYSLILCIFWLEDRAKQAASATDRSIAHRDSQMADAFPGRREMGRKAYADSVIERHEHRPAARAFEHPHATL